MAPSEPWEKVLVNAETFPQTVHGHIACTDCHKGEQSPDKEAAHEGLVGTAERRNPNACSECHDDVSSVYAHSLHSTQEGHWTVLDQRSVPENHPQLEEMFGNHCALVTHRAETATSASRSAWAGGFSTVTTSPARLR